MDEQATELLRTNLHEVFGQRDPAARLEAAERTYAPDVEFTDEEGTVRGRAAVADRARSLLERIPADFAFSEDSPVYVGESHAALAWRLGRPDAEPVARGIDIMTIADGRITGLLTLLTR